MRTLLTFFGSIIYLFVMVVISPLLVVVYAGLEAVYLLRFVKQHIRLLVRPFTNVSLPVFHLPAKRYFLTLWTKAMRFHL